MSANLIWLLYEATLQTLYMVAASTVLGTVFGLPLGVFLATSQRGELLSAPWLNKVLGLAATIIGALAGGSLMSRWGLYRSLMAFGLLQAVSNLAYWLIAVSPKSIWLMAGGVGIENLCGGLGTRLGAPYAKQIEQAMTPHLFVPERPPDVRVAELGDLGGAIGATLLVARS